MIQNELYRFSANPVVRVSSARIIDTFFKTDRALAEKSSIQPIGVLTRCLVVTQIQSHYSVPVRVYLLTLDAIPRKMCKDRNGLFIRENIRN